MSNSDLQKELEFLKKITIESNETWKKSLYYNFLKTCTRQEFLDSQIPFYYAVNAFPSMLLKLASMIYDNEKRLTLIENIWEEHGCGDFKNFHMNTFKNHLKALNDNIEPELYENPFVTIWIDNILEEKYSAENLGTILFAIEYIYAFISTDIADFTLSVDVVSPHYQTHSILDLSHGEELFHLVKNLGYDINQDLFQKTQIEFINLFNKLCSPTEVELTQASKIPISFFYSREDSNVGLKALSKIKKDNINIFSICSGGENVLNYLLNFNDKKLSVTLFDVNQNQLDLFDKKLFGEFKDNIAFEQKGKFEFFFNYLISTIKNTNSKEFSRILNDYKLFDYLMSKIFSRKNLNIVFSEDATKYSSDSFASHFSKAIRYTSNSNNKNFENIYFNSPLMDYNFKSKINFNNFDINKVCKNIKDYDFNSNFDFIDISNIGDWMPLDDYKNIIKKAYNSLNENGILITRKLLGDYNLKELLYMFSENEVIIDNTLFYSECYISRK